MGYTETEVSCYYGFISLIFSQIWQLSKWFAIIFMLVFMHSIWIKNFLQTFKNSRISMFKHLVSVIEYLVSFITSLPGQTQQLDFTPPSVVKPPSTMMAATMTEHRWSITVGRSFRRMISCWLETGISLTLPTVTFTVTLLHACFHYSVLLIAPSADLSEANKILRQWW